MPENAIVVENVSKSYLLGHRADGQYKHTTLRDVIGRQVRDFARKAGDLIRGRQIVQGDEIEEFWALKDVNFRVKQGEVLGIIGRNGAGKSTLLKILSRVTEPTRGRISLNGRVSSLLEVGTGFHLELTGRENIYLNGAILGMTQREIRKKFDDIVAFAEVERFLDAPVKHYSSGMYVRLAFAVAAHLEPEILILDEVLAVGDAEFQKKCFGKIDEVSHHDGRTILFVSHNMGALTSLCPNAIWLEGGSVRDHGNSRAIAAQYLSQGMSSRNQLLPLADVPRPSGIQDNCLRLEALEWLCDLPLKHGEPLKARIYFRTRAPVSDATVGIGFSNLESRRLLTYDTDFEDGFRPTINEAGSYAVDVEVESLPLAPDSYELDIGCRSGDFHPLDYIPAAARVDVIPGPRTPDAIVRQGAGVRLVGNWTWRDLNRASPRLASQSVKDDA